MVAGIAVVWLVAAPVDFVRQVRPILESRCYPCHGPALQTHQLRLDRRTDALKGGESGVPAIVPGNSAASLLVKYVSGLDPEIVMPAKGPRLTSDQIAVLKTWIDQGAPWDTPTPSNQNPTAASQHWSFQPLRRPAIPAVQDRSWVRNPIDAFVLARLEARGWKPSPPAETGALRRRVFLDLTGLPPSLDEQQRALGLEDLVDDLLARRAYGERWARHWLDLVRYAESNGYERDAAKPHAWRYRDYVIRALNDDKPFDRFVIEQLAGDELDEISAETLIATGYHRLGPWDDEPADPQEDRFDQLDDLVSTTSQVFLGLTLGCARCHNHKFEPLTASDYYSMAAIFNPLERPRKGRTELDLPAGARAEIEAQNLRDRRIEPLASEIRGLRDAFQDELVRAGRSKLPEAVLQALRLDPAQRNDNDKKRIRDHAAAIAAEVEANLPADVRARITSLEARIAGLKQATPDLPRGYFLHEPSPTPPPTHILLRGKASRPGPEVGPGVPAVIPAPQPVFTTARDTSGRRLALARWLVSRDNPLTARVLVNRVWQAHFGEGLVRTPSDFGVMGEKPTHPELLDWLACWFIDQGWSLKKLHRLILTSNTYQMSRASNPRYLAEDPENRLLWRFPYTRLEVEAIRDSILAVSGRLNAEMYGPSIYPHIPEAAFEGHSDPDKVWKNSPEPEANRRTIYAFLKRSMVVPMLEVLDLCDTTRTSARRATTSVAPQALTLFNGEFLNRQARYFAERLRREAGDEPDRQIDRAFRLALARAPGATERAAALEFLRRESLVELCRVLFNLNEFVYPD